jgi:phosphoribosyl 1,2-cyclic phosphodiesterase
MNRSARVLQKTPMPSTKDQFTVHFWGVRGSIACPGPETVKYGGNTPCVEMRVGGKRLIFDGGTGLRVLGQHLLSNMPVEACLFFTHSHWDHIQGFPFFTPAFIKGNKFHVYGAIAPNGATIEQRLNDQMLHPNFPVPLQIMGAQLDFNDLEVGATVQLDDVKVESALLNHPGEAVGYRVNWKNHAVAYITDTEHYADHLDPNVQRLAHQADVMIYDATYTDNEYHDPRSSKKGWGHSTWQEAVKAARAAQVKTLVIFHHDPLHKDESLDQIGEDAKREFPGAIMAVEGLEIVVTAETTEPESDPVQDAKISA